MTKMAKYLNQDHAATIDVLTRKKTESNTVSFDNTAFVHEFYYAEEAPFSQKLIALYKKHSFSDAYTETRRKEINAINQGNKPSIISTCKIWLRSVFAVAWSSFTARAYMRPAYKLIKENRYDCIISSFGPEASHYIGRKIKQHNPNTLWIADYRDPLYSGEATKGFLAYWAKTFACRITKEADAITTVSEGFVDCLGLRGRNNVYVITNGYDRDDIGMINADSMNNSCNDKMELCYVGSLLVGRRDISPVLQALQELISCGEIDPKRIRIQYAGLNWKEFNVQISEYDLPIEIVNNKQVSKKEALQLEAKTDVLLMAAWNTKGYTGSLPLKLYEYMMIGKPIICTVSGNQGNSEVKTIIDRCNIGYCYESTGGELSYKGLKKYICMMYQAYCDNKNNTVQYSPVITEIDKYNYKYLTNRIFSIITEKNNAGET